MIYIYIYIYINVIYIYIYTHYYTCIYTCMCFISCIVVKYGNPILYYVETNAGMGMLAASREANDENHERPPAGGRESSGIHKR